MVDASERPELRNISVFISPPVLQRTRVDYAAGADENGQQAGGSEPHIVRFSVHVAPLKATVARRALNVVSGSEEAMMNV
jgi:hypothetical protein